MTHTLRMAPLLLAFWAIPGRLAAQEPDQIRERRQAVEHGLLTAAVLEGHPVEGMKLGERMAYYGTPGVSIAVINHGYIEWARGYGVSGVSGQPVDTSTRFQAASISKAVTAAAALKLVERHRLELDLDVNTWLTRWKLPESGYTREQPVTLRQILTHSAGLPVSGFPGYAAGQPLPTLVQVLDGEPPAVSAPIRSDTVPGTLWRYSSGGFTVLQQLLVDVTGKPFTKLMEQLVLRPAGMNQSTFEQPLPRKKAAQAASGFRVGAVPLDQGWRIYPEMAAAGLWSTPSDLARFAIALQLSLDGGAGTLLSRDMAAEMLRPQFGPWGLGLTVSATGAMHFSHGGANEGFRCLMVAFNDLGKGAVIMTNSDAGYELAWEILRGIAREYRWPTYQPATRNVAQVDPRIYPGLAGQYPLVFGPDTLILTVTASAEGPRIQVPLWKASRALYPASESRYFVLQDDTEFTFERDSSGSVVQVVISRGETGGAIRARRRLAAPSEGAAGQR